MSVPDLDATGVRFKSVCADADLQAMFAAQRGRVTMALCALAALAACGPIVKEAAQLPGKVAGAKHVASTPSTKSTPRPVPPRAPSSAVPTSRPTSVSSTSPSSTPPSYTPTGTATPLPTISAQPVPGTQPTTAPTAARRAMPDKVVGGYLESWSRLLPSQLPAGYNVLFYAFAEIDATGATSLHPAQDRARLISDIADNRAAGKPTLLSIGGAGGAQAGLSTPGQVSAFLRTVQPLIEQYGFAGIDWDLETAVPGGISADGIVAVSRQLVDQFGPDFAITMAPSSESTFPAYQAAATKMRDILTFVGFQYYNNSTVPTSAYVLRVMQDWMRTCGLTPSQWTLGFLHSDDWLHLITPFDAMTGTYSAVKALYPTLRGAWTWGIDEKDRPLGYPFAAALSAVS